VHMEPMLSISTSDLLSLVTLPCFSPLCEARDTTHVSTGGAQRTAGAEVDRLAVLLPSRGGVRHNAKSMLTLVCSGLHTLASLHTVQRRCQHQVQQFEGGQSRAQLARRHQQLFTAAST
jgi:hypothetical protein